MKSFIEISNLIVDNNIVNFTLIPNIHFTVIDLSVYVDNLKLSINNFSLKSSNNSYTLTINEDILITDTLYFYINTPDFFTGIIYIYYSPKTLEFNNSISVFSLSTPLELESYNYDLSFIKIDDIFINSPTKNFIICNGISPSSTINLISSNIENKTFEINLLDSLNNPIPDGSYVIEIFTEV